MVKRIAKPHQYFAVTKAVAKTVNPVESNGKAGVVWHTQGSGKSMEMELYTNLVSHQSKLLNPTIVVITDRTELDGQLFETFNRSLLLPEKPKQIKRRSELREELSNRTTGGIYFTTLQKFGRNRDEREAGADHPLLSDRRNIIVIVDEAHRSHYDDLDGYAWHLKNALPHATLIAFTGTPISFEDRNSADEVTIGLDDAERTRIEQSVAVVNAAYGAPARLATLAENIVAQWESRRDRMRPFIEAPGKAMIVCATREICANLYAAITALRPDWHSDDLDKGRIKVVYSGTPSDKPPVVHHVRRDSLNATIKKRLTEVNDELEIVIVKDMMLTGYDSPPLHTLYLDRPLKGALLMQTLARVNRTYRGKQDGLLVAYAPLAENLKKALSEYTQDDQEHKPLGRNIDDAAALTESLVATIRGLLPGRWKAARDAGGSRRYAQVVYATVNYLRDAATAANQVPAGEEPLAGRYRALSSQLARAWAICGGSETLTDLHPEVRLYEEVRVWMAKFDAEDRQSRGEPIPEEIQRLLGQLLAESTVSGGVLDIYAAAGMPKPTLTDLTPDFIVKTQHASNPHLAIEALRKLLNEESTKATRSNVVRQRAFSERLTELMNKYTNQRS